MDRQLLLITSNSDRTAPRTEDPGTVTRSSIRVPVAVVSSAVFQSTGIMSGERKANTTSRYPVSPPSTAFAWPWGLSRFTVSGSGTKV